jgi:hypothetical protein
VISVFWGLVFLFCFSFGLYLMVVQPLSKKKSLSIYFDWGLGCGLVVAAFLYVTLAHLVPLYNSEVSTTPCSTQSPQAVCYDLAKTTCLKAWESFADGCQAEVKPILEKRPSALVHSIVYKCQARKFDQIVFYNRRRMDSPFCREYFAKIQE